MSSNQSSFFTNYVAGMTQATLVTIVGYPFDLVKSRTQAKIYQSATKCAIDILQNKGFIGLYRGVSAPWISHLIKRPLQFPLTEYLKNRNFGNNYVIGFVSGVIGPVFGTPLQLIKVQMQTNNSGGMISFIQKRMREQGIIGFYRGFLPTLIKDCVFAASFVGNYYTFRDYLGTDRWWKNFLSGSVAHCITWSLFIPIDFIKTNIQKSNQSIGIAQVISVNYQKYGLKVFWRGLGAACVRTIPVSGIAMTGYEFIRTHLTK